MSSNIDKPSIGTTLGALRMHFDAANNNNSSREGKRDALTAQTTHKIEHIYQRANDLTQQSKDHFARHRDRWIYRQYGQLLKGAGPIPAPAPAWASRDKSVQLHRAATTMVDQRHHKRQRNIQKAMIREVKKVATRAIGRARSKGREEDRGR